MAKDDKKHLQSARNQRTTKVNINTNHHKFRKKGSASIHQLKKYNIMVTPSFYFASWEQWLACEWGTPKEQRQDCALSLACQNSQQDYMRNFIF